jgi:hypothetical protein
MVKIIGYFVDENGRHAMMDGYYLAQSDDGK